MALSPLAYWPMRESAGVTANDISGNSHAGTYQAGATVNQDGKYGKCVKFETTVNYGLTLPASLLTALDPREFSISIWRKAATSSEEKVYEGWNAANDYFAFEVRDLLNGIFMKEGGVQQVISSDVLAGVTENAWTHLVLFNSESTGKVGIYLDGVLKQTDRTLGGITPPITAAATGFAGNVTGYYQHIAFWNKKLSQAEVNTICT